MGFFLVLLLVLAALAFWMWKRPDPVQRDQAKAVHHELWLEQVDAQYTHALRLLTDPVQPNYIRAYELFEDLAKQHDFPNAYMQMGLMQLKGQGRDTSVEAALGLLENAFRLGSEEAAYYLGQIYEGQYQVLANNEKALYWYRHAVVRGHLDAQYRLTVLEPEDQTQAEQQRFNLLQQNAEQEHANSEYLLAQHYLEQSPANWSEGLHYLLRAASRDHLQANQQLQHMYQSGYGVARDQQTSLRYLKRCLSLGDQTHLYDYYQAVFMGLIDVDQRQRVYADVLDQAKTHKNVQAKTLLGHAHFHGWYLDKNETLGFRFWSEAAQAEYAPALAQIAALYYEQHLVANDPQKAFDLYRYAEQKQSSYMTKMGLGLCYLHGVGTTKNQQMALQYIQEATESTWHFPIKTKADLYIAIAEFYAQVTYPLAHHERVVEYLNQAAGLQSAEAHWCLYLLYSANELAIPLDADLALKHLQQAVEYGHVQASTALAKLQLEHPKDHPETSLQLLQQAAAQHYAEAQYLLAQCYEKGIGVEIDLAQAAEYYRLAAQQFHPVALTALGRMYMYGEGVERDLGTAQIWLKKAVLLEYEPAIAQLENIQDYLTIT